MRIRKMQEEDVSCPHNKKDEEEGKKIFHVFPPFI